MVTVAIHSYDKAHILKTILESEGIPAVIHGVRMIEPVVPGNVRVRINESDLPRALKIIEELDFTEQDDKMLQRENKKEILVPVDFSDFSLTACAFAFRLAYDLDCEVKLMHVFFTPFYPASVPFGDSFAIQPADKTIYQDVKSKTEKEMQQLVARIKEQVTKGILPDVPFHTQLVEGLPEEEVISYSKKISPRLSSWAHGGAMPRNWISLAASQLR